MPRGNPQNLKPFNSLTEEERKNLASKAGKASGEARRARKTLREELLALLSQGNKQEQMTVAIYEKALLGDTKAFELIRDTIGEKPVEKVMVADIDASIISDVENMVKGNTVAQKIICKNKSNDEVIKTYLSVKEAAEDLGLFAGNISKCLSGKIKTCGGYKWEYEH